mgnify:CR=1 FL=1
MANILIADSGSTKTDWFYKSEKGEVITFKSAGLNPYFYTPEQLSTEIDQAIPSSINRDSCVEVTFYGSGCSSNERQNEIKDAISQSFPLAKTEVHSDLMAAARCSLGKKKGMVIIIGTGSNVALFDGTNITNTIQSLGFMYGDQASGAWFGKALMTDYLTLKMPEMLSKQFADWHKLSFEQILEKTYRNNQPSRFLASLVPFMNNHLDNSYINSLLKRGFNSFFCEMAAQLPAQQGELLGAVGSITYYFKPFLEEVATDRGFHLFAVTNTPIDGLKDYHSLCK